MTRTAPVQVRMASMLGPAVPAGPGACAHSSLLFLARGPNS